jgi:hypothetical protein
MPCRCHDITSYNSFRVLRRRDNTRFEGDLMQKLATPIVLIVLTGILAGCAMPLQFTITFKNARGLQAGNAVVYKGIKIGEVREVAIEQATGAVRVEVSIDSKYQNSVYREALYMIDRPQGQAESSTERQITITDSGEIRTPVRPGDLIEGTEPVWDQLRDAIRGAAREIFGSGGGKGGSAGGSATK